MLNLSSSPLKKRLTFNGMHSSINFQSSLTITLTISRPSINQNQQASKLISDMNDKEHQALDDYFLDFIRGTNEPLSIFDYIEQTGLCLRTDPIFADRLIFALVFNSQFNYKSLFSVIWQNAYALFFCHRPNF